MRLATFSAALVVGLLVVLPVASAWGIEICGMRVYIDEKCTQGGNCGGVDVGGSPELPQQDLLTRSIDDILSCIYTRIGTEDQCR